MENKITTVIYLVEKELIKIIVTAHVAGWVRIEDSSALDYATYCRHEYNTEDSFTIMKIKDSINLVAYSSEDLEDFAAVEAWVGNKQ